MIFICLFSQQKVKNITEPLNSSKLARTDNIARMLVKHIFDALAELHSVAIDNSLCLGRFPMMETS